MQVLNHTQGIIIDRVGIREKIGRDTKIKAVNLSKIKLDKLDSGIDFAKIRFLRGRGTTISAKEYSANLTMDKYKQRDSSIMELSHFLLYLCLPILKTIDKDTQGLYFQTSDSDKQFSFLKVFDELKSSILGTEWNCITIDFFAKAILESACAIDAAFAKMVQDGNFLCAIPFIRLQMDNALGAWGGLR